MLIGKILIGCGGLAPPILIDNLGNKCDMEEKRMISKERGEKVAEENGIKFYETSAKDNVNIEHAFITVI